VTQPWAERGVEPGLDGALRCPWALSSPDYTAYHDDEWGRPVHGDRALLERLVLEGFQSGLSWLTILRKRPAFRAAFAGFDPVVVSEFGPGDVDRLLADAGIVRHRGKIEAAIANARAVLRLQHKHGADALDRLMWAHAPDPASRPVPVTLGDVPTRTGESAAMARALKAEGFVFVGPVTAYATMQACGLVDDHLAGCLARRSEMPGKFGILTPEAQSTKGSTTWRR
jgi:DNA-3-methyladenine glycosylase I